MLTPDDRSTDGCKTDYLSEQGYWSKYDPPLFAQLYEVMNAKKPKHVSLLEKTEIFNRTSFFSTEVPDSPQGRTAWFDQLRQSAISSDLVFLDPDNGFEVKSKNYGTKNSSKYLFWREIRLLWDLQKSLLIYQHFTRENHAAFIRRIMTSLHVNTPGSMLTAFTTPNVLFCLALQPSHTVFYSGILSTVADRWCDQIRISGFENDAGTITTFPLR